MNLYKGENPQWIVDIFRGVGGLLLLGFVAWLVLSSGNSPRDATLWMGLGVIGWFLVWVRIPFYRPPKLISFFALVETVLIFGGIFAFASVFLVLTKNKEGITGVAMFLGVSWLVIMWGVVLFRLAGRLGYFLGHGRDR